MCIRFLCF
jgi:hypothetical protein